MDLTDRQRQLLKAIVELHVKTGSPVGSENIEKDFDLGVSPATIRNEMVRLTEMGFLKQPHTSAGRVPTSMGFRVFINELMREKELPVAAEVKIKQDLWQQRFKEQHLLREATKALASRCRMLALAVNEDNEIYYSGAANILDFPEFEDIDVTRFVLSLFDENPMLQDILGRAVGTDPLHVLFGEDLGYEHLMYTSFVFSKFEGKDGKRGIIGVIGPARMNFPVVLPYVKFTSNLIEQALASW
jgi:heat-inducible transcriptional repressor